MYCITTLHHVFCGVFEEGHSLYKWVLCTLDIIVQLFCGKNIVVVTLSDEGK